MTTYSFLDISATITGPGGSFSLGSGSGNAEEGITIEASEDIDSMTIGADGSVMHSLHANKSGTVTIHYLKISPQNAKLSAMYALQTAAGALHGNNTIVVSNLYTNDVIAMTQVAFRRAPNINYAKEGGLVDWQFNAGVIERTLGTP